MNGHLTLDEMQNYVGLAEREIATQKAQNVVLREELERSQRLIESLQYKLHESEATILRGQQKERVSHFGMEKMESGGTVRVIMKQESEIIDEVARTKACQSSGCCGKEYLYDSGGGFEEYQTEFRSVRNRRNVVLEKESCRLSMYSVHLSQCEPCPSPIHLNNTGVQLVSDPAHTMCAVWDRWTDQNEMYKKRVRRTAKKRRTRVKKAVKEAFGSFTMPEDSTLFQAVCGFIEGSQDGEEENK